MTLYLHIPKSNNGGRITRIVKDYAEASRLYSEERDKRGEGASTFESGGIESKIEFEAVKLLAVISYNGKVWSPDEPLGRGAPLYDPYAKEA